MEYTKVGVAMDLNISQPKASKLIRKYCNENEGLNALFTLLSTFLMKALTKL